MIQRFLAWGLFVAMNWVDDSVAEEDLQAFVKERLQELVERIHTGSIGPDDQDVRAVRNATERLRELGASWLAHIDLDAISPDSPAGETPIPMSEGSNVAVLREHIASGIADQLLASLNRDEPMGTRQIEQMENLLRHIEVRRRAGLRFHPSMIERWSEIQKISLLFTRHAEQRQDYRFLNTALKLNDWSYKHYRTRRLTPALLTYLQAVLEAEATLIAMTI